MQSLTITSGSSGSTCFSGIPMPIILPRTLKTVSANTAFFTVPSCQAATKLNLRSRVRVCKFPSLRNDCYKWKIVTT